MTEFAPDQLTMELLGAEHQIGLWIGRELTADRQPSPKPRRLRRRLPALGAGVEPVDLVRRLNR